MSALSLGCTSSMPLGPRPEMPGGELGSTPTRHDTPGTARDLEISWTKVCEANIYEGTK